VWQLLDVGALSHDMTSDMMLSTGPLSMTVDAETLAAATSADAEIASVAAMAMNAGRHMTAKWRTDDELMIYRLCSLHWFTSTPGHPNCGRRKRSSRKSMEKEFAVNVTTKIYAFWHQRSVLERGMLNLKLSLPLSSHFSQLMCCHCLFVLWVLLSPWFSASWLRHRQTPGVSWDHHWVALVDRNRRCDR